MKGLFWYLLLSQSQQEQDLRVITALQKQKLLLLPSTFAFLLVPLLLVVLLTQVMLRGGLFVLYAEEWRKGDARGGRGVTSQNNILF